MGVKNDNFCSEMGSGFGELGGTHTPRIPGSTTGISFLLDKKRDIEYIPLTLSRGYYDFLQSGLWLTLLNSCKSWPFFFFLSLTTKRVLGFSVLLL